MFRGTNARVVVYRREERRSVFIEGIDMVDGRKFV
jgi:hypothetical protein